MKIVKVKKRKIMDIYKKQQELIKTEKVYTIEDLLHRRIVMKNTDEERTKCILIKAYGARFEDNELPGDLYYVTNESSSNKFTNIESFEITGNLNIYGEMVVPEYLKGYRNKFHYHDCENLPIVCSKHIIY